MHSPSELFTPLFLLTLLPFQLSASQFQSDFGKWNSASQVSYASRPSRYQIPQNGHNNYLQTKYSRLGADNVVEGRRNGLRISYAQDKTRYNIPFYDSSYKMKQTLTSPRPNNGIGNGHHLSLIPYASKRTHFQKPFYDSNRIIKGAISSSSVQNHVWSGRDLVMKADGYQKPFFNSKMNMNQMLPTVKSSNVPRVPYASKSLQRSSLLTYRHPPKGKYHWIQYSQGNNYPGLSFVFNTKVQQKLSIPRLQSGIGIGKVPWAERKPTVAYYRALSYVPSHTRDRSSFSNLKATLRAGALNSPYGRSVEPNMYSEQHGNRPYVWERKKSYIFPPPPPRSRESSLTSNYHLDSKLETIPAQSYGYLYTNGDVAIQSVFPQLNHIEDRLIPERMSDQQATSRAGDASYSMVNGHTRLAPRKSYVAASFTERQGQLNDPQLNRLGNILQSLRKRSTKNVDGKQVVYLVPNPGPFGRKGRHSVTGTYKFYIEKRNSEKVSERKSAMHKEKGKLNLGFLNDISPNIRLVSMILLKQKRDGIHKRDLNVHPRSLEKSSRKENHLAERRVQKTIEGATQNHSKQGMLSTNQSKISFFPSVISFSGTMPGRSIHRGSQNMHTKKNRTSSRSVIQDSTTGVYIYPAKKHGRKTYLPLLGMEPDQRQIMQFLDSREQFEEQPMEMEKRLRAMRLRGLLNSLAYINPQFFFRPPLRYPMRPFQQGFDSMERNELPARRFPTRNMGFAFGMREPQEINFDDQLQEKSEYPAATSVVESNLNFPFSPPQAGIREQFENDQSSLGGHSPQILQIEANKLYGGFQNRNTNPFDDRSQGSTSYINQHLTTMQAVNQPFAVLNRWFPVGPNRISFMADPRKFSSQWPSRLPGLEHAVASNVLPARGYPVLGSAYQDTEARVQPVFDKGGSSSSLFKYASGIERVSTGFSRRSLSSFPTHSMDRMKGTVKTLPSKIKGHVIHATKKSFNVSQDKKHLSRKKRLDRSLTESKKGEHSSEKQRQTTGETKQIVNPKINSNKTKQGSLTYRSQSNGRVTRNYVNMMNYVMNHGMLPNTPALEPLYTPADLGIGRNIQWKQITARQTPIEYPIYGKGFSTKSKLSDLGDSIRTWPFSPERQFDQVDVPREMLDLSQQVDQVPGETSFPRDDAQTQPSYAKSMTTFQLNGNEETNEPQSREYQPYQSLPLQDPLAFSQAQASFPLQSSGDYETKKKETEQNGPEVITLPSNYAGGESGLTPGQNARNPFESVPAYPEQSITEFKQTAESIPEDGTTESTVGKRRDLSDGTETFTEKDGVQGITYDMHDETDPSFTPGLLDGLDNSQAKLLQQQIGVLGTTQDGLASVPLSENPLSFSGRHHLQQNPMARRKAFFQLRSHFNSKVIGNTQGRTGIRKGHRLRLPSLSLDSIEKMIDSASMEDGKASYNMNGISGYGSKTTGTADRAAGDYDQDWKSALMRQSPNDFKSQLENSILQWSRATNPNHKTASSSDPSFDSPSGSEIVPPTGASDSQDIVPGFTFDTQGQRPGPLFLTKPPPGLESDSNVETVLMVPPQGERLKEQSGTKKGTIHGKKVQNENTKKSKDKRK